MIEMDDRITVSSLLATQNAQRLNWQVMSPQEQEEVWKLLYEQKRKEEAEERESTEPSEEWGDLEDHGWMGTSLRNNSPVQIRDNFPASFG